MAEALKTIAPQLLSLTGTAQEKALGEVEAARAALEADVMLVGATQPLQALPVMVKEGPPSYSV